MKRFSFIGDGLSHVAFGAMTIASVLGLTNDMPLVLAITILSAILLLRTGQNAIIKGDAAVAMISVGALAVGYLLMNLFSSSSNLSGDVCSTLFGSTSILTLTKTEVRLCAVLSVLVVAAFVLFCHKVFAVTFDESFAAATGVNTGVYNFIIAVIIAVIIVLAMNLVGSLLISALVIFPALSAGLQELSRCDDLLGDPVCFLLASRHPDFHSRRDAGGFNHRRGGYCDVLCFFRCWSYFWRCTRMKKRFLSFFAL